MKHFLIPILLIIVSCSNHDSQKSRLITPSDSLFFSYKGKMYENEHNTLRLLQKQGKDVNDLVGYPTGISVRIDKQNKHIIYLYIKKESIHLNNSVLAVFTHLKSLNFESTDIKNFKGFQRLQFLKELKLYNCSDLDDFIEIPYSLRKLETLTIKNSNLRDIVFPKNCKLKNLTLTGNHLNKLNNTFKRLKYLEYLELAVNPLEDFDLSSLKKLKIIVIGRTSIRDTTLIKQRHPNVKIYFGKERYYPQNIN